MHIQSSGSDDPLDPRDPRATLASETTEEFAEPPAASRRRRKNAAGGGFTLPALPKITLPRIPRPRSRGAILVSALVAVLLLAGGGAAFALDKRVTLTVDGQSRTVHTFGGTVQDVLDAEEIILGEHDAVAPEADTALTSGAQVLVRTGREFTLAVDGEEGVAHWVTALTVEEALNQLGLDADTLTLSVARTTPVPVEGLSVDARSARHIVILRDRVRVESHTNAITVADAIQESGIELGEHDTVEPGLDEEPVNGMVVKVTQLIGAPQTKETPIEAEVEERDNDELPKGEKKVVTEPVDGVKEVTYGLVLKEGVETEHVLSEKVIKEPVRGVTEVGTKEPEHNPNVGGPADSLNWSALAQCESTGNPSAVNPAGYYGLYQFSLATWQSAGGSGLPSEASPDEQTMRAKKLYNMVGGNWQSQWPQCGIHLFD